MPKTRIAEVEAEALNLPLVEPFAIATGSQLSVRNIVVKVRLADGTTGLGEAAPFPDVTGETQEEAFAAIRHAREGLIDEDVEFWRDIAKELLAAIPKAPAARCALEMAVIDALTRVHGIPLHKFFGGKQVSLITDMTVTAGDRLHARRMAERVWERGITRIKVKVGASSPEEDVARLAAIHTGVPEARLLADANGGYDAEQALAFLEGLRRAGIELELFEQPVPRDDWEGMAKVTDATPTLVCADESAATSEDVLRLSREHAAGAINIKLMKSGVSEALSMWNVARATGMRLMIGGMVESILAMSFSAHFAAGLGSFEFVDLDTPLFIEKHPFRGGFRLAGERISLGDGVAGHGVTIAEK